MSSTSRLFNARLNPVPTFEDYEPSDVLENRARIPSAAWSGPIAGSPLVMTQIDDLGPRLEGDARHRVAVKVLVDTYAFDRATRTRGKDEVDIQLRGVRQALPHVGAYRDLKNHRVDVFADLLETDARTAQLSIFTAGKVFPLTSIEDGGDGFDLRRRDSSLAPASERSPGTPGNPGSLPSKGARGEGHSPKAEE